MQCNFVLNRTCKQNIYLLQLRNILEIQVDVVTNEYKWCPVNHLLELFNFSHTLHGLIESFTCLLAFGKCIVEETHELQGSLVANRPQGYHNRSGTGTQSARAMPTTPSAMTSTRAV